MKQIIILLAIIFMVGCGTVPAPRRDATPRPEPRTQATAVQPFDARGAKAALDAIRGHLADLDASMEIDDFVSIAVSFGGIVEEFEKLKGQDGPGNDQQLWQGSHQQGIDMAIKGTEAALARDKTGVGAAKESIGLWIQTGAYRF